MFFTYKINEDLKLKEPMTFHAPEFCQIVNENYDYLREWVPWVTENFSVERANELIGYYKENNSSNKSLSLFIFWKNRLVGGFYFGHYDFYNRTTDIGYWISADCQGNGLVLTACQAMINYAFEDLGFNRIEIRCATENLKSQAIPKKLGFQYEGQLRQAEWLYDKFVDNQVYSLLRSEWRS